MTRDNVEYTLTRIIQRLRTYSEFPDNGLAVFAGYTDAGFSLKELVPPKPIYAKLYWCSAEFVLDPLRLMTQNTELTAIVSIDATECSVGYYDGLHAYVVKGITSGVSGKSHKGGSSARRYERDREAKLLQYYTRASDLTNKVFLPMLSRVRTLVVSGPGFTKGHFLDRNLIDYRLRAKLRVPVDIEYAGDDGIYQTVNRL